MGRNKIHSFPTLNLLLEEENAEFPDAKNVTVENLEELTLDFDFDTFQRMWLNTAAYAVHLTLMS